MHRGFSLVELSIVLVILGLLTGGILAGQSLIRASELRAVSTEYQRYVSAANSFRDKYFALPGDFRDATKFWGVAGGTGSDTTCFDVTSTTAATCNGNGDGQVYDNGGARYSEVYRAWQHLANAGLIEGSYTGRASTATYAWSLVAGTNMPASKLSPSHWMIAWAGQVTGDPNTFDGSYGNTLHLGSGSSPLGMSLRAEEMWNIDTKMDDGKPAVGKVRAHKNAFRPSCVTTDVISTAEYALTSTLVGCNALFLQVM